MQGFDPDVLREKYREERDRRLRADGNDQYVEVVGQFARYTDDPHAGPLERPSRHDEVDVVIIGGGFGGLLAGARLREAGIKDVWIIEKGADFGGTWYWNRYPGARCDVDAYIYLPLLEELGYMPTEKYAGAPEILAHSQAIGRHFDLYRDALFQTAVTECRWDEDRSRWIIRTNRGDRLLARFVCMATGPMHRPKLPGIPGIETFRGHSFHTTRWDYAYTGGDHDGGLTGLRDKRVGIIGTGASAVQCVPHLGEAAEHLYVFQRTPSSVGVLDNRPTDPTWATGLQPGWQQRRMENFTNFFSGVFEPVDLVNDGWTDIVRNLLDTAERSDGDFSPAGIAKMIERADFEQMEQVRARVEAIVNDPITAQALKPYYRKFCKRPCFHDEYLHTFNRANVTLVDTNGKGVDRITERGVVVGDREYEVDCLIYATGFEVGTDYARRAGYEIHGRNGLTFAEKWADGPSTFHGMHSRGFPNCFVFRVVQAAFTVSYPHLLNEQSKHLAYMLKHAFSNGIDVIEASQDAEAAWVRLIIEQSGGELEFVDSCTPSYHNNEGRRNKHGARYNSFGGGASGYFKLLAEWRAEGTLDGLELTSRDSPERTHGRSCRVQGCPMHDERGDGC